MVQVRGRSGYAIKGRVQEDHVDEQQSRRMTGHIEEVQQKAKALGANMTIRNGNVIIIIYKMPSLRSGSEFSQNTIE
jgi:hypothetical protein